MFVFLNCKFIFHNKSLPSVPAPGHAGRSLEISNMVDIRSEVNRELVMRVVSDVANGNRFYSDLNSFQVHDVTLINDVSVSWLID